MVSSEMQINGEKESITSAKSVGCLMILEENLVLQ